MKHSHTVTILFPLFLLSSAAFANLEVSVASLGTFKSAEKRGHSVILAEKRGHSVILIIDMCRVFSLCLLIWPEVYESRKRMACIT